MELTTSSLVLLYWGNLDRASARKFFPPGKYFSVKLNWLKYCIHLSYLDEFFGGRVFQYL